MSYLLKYVVVCSKRLVVPFLLSNLSEMFENKSELLFKASALAFDVAEISNRNLNKGKRKVNSIT